MWPYDTYRKAALFFALVDLLYQKLFSKITITEGTTWPQALATWIRSNDTALWKGTKKVLDEFQEDICLSGSIEEVLDICGLLKEGNGGDNFVKSALETVA